MFCSSPPQDTRKNQRVSQSHGSGVSSESNSHCRSMVPLITECVCSNPTTRHIMGYS